MNITHVGTNGVGLYRGRQRPLQWALHWALRWVLL